MSCKWRHSELCKQKNGIKPTNFSSSNNTTEAKIKDVSEEFKKCLVELATEKIWLAPMKIWNIARNKIVSAGNDVALSFLNSDVVRTDNVYVYYNLTTFPSFNVFVCHSFFDFPFFDFHGKL